jgi:hypothetical protein
LLTAAVLFSPLSRADDEPVGAKEREREIQPVALLQLWGTAYDMDADPQADATSYGDPEDDAGVAVKRARLGVEGREQGFTYELVFGLSKPYDAFDEEDGSIEVVDATVGYRKAGFGVEGGRAKLPFSRDQMMASSELTFTERGLGAEHVAPDRALGLAGFASKFGGKLTLGVFNSGGNLFGDDNLGKTLVGRLEYEKGDSYVTFRKKSRDVVVGVGAGGFLTDDVATKTSTLGGDFLVRVVGLSLLGDVAYEIIEPTATTVDEPGVWEKTTRMAVTSQLSYGLGDFEPAVRYTLLQDSASGTWSQLMGGLVWHGLYDKASIDRVRVGAGYVHRFEENERANDTVRLWGQFRL